MSTSPGTLGATSEVSRKRGGASASGTESSGTSAPEEGILDSSLASESTTLQGGAPPNPPFLFPALSYPGSCLAFLPLSSDSCDPTSLPHRRLRVQLALVCEAGKFGDDPRGGHSAVDPVAHHMRTDPCADRQGVEVSSPPSPSLLPSFPSFPPLLSSFSASPPPPGSHSCLSSRPLMPGPQCVEGCKLL